ncbi:MAG: indolepyruvate ferredoxin oxidoreductase subunit alpha [candidate division KSB1 bacterium]|nr:indolepyruvate ferredoxin oxidoreductase subunit alpha [candidate division KSB1 bacterium]
MKALLSGNEAIARGAYEAGARFAAAYPGTPSTEILENTARYKEITSQWSPNEKVALEVAAGASLGGARALAAMKHVGLNVAADPLFSLSYLGVNAGLVIISADDPSLHSSQNEQDNRWYARAAKIPMLEPADSQEAKDFTVRAFEISEIFDTPVLLRTTTRVNHSKGIVQLSERMEPAERGYKKDISKNVLLPSNARGRHAFVEERLKKLEEFNNQSDLNQVEWGDRSLGIITSGVAYQYAREVFPQASFLKLGLTNPLPRKLIQNFAAQVREIYVIEELDPFLEEQVKALGLKVIGKEKVPLLYELDPQRVAEAFAVGASETSEPVLKDLKIPGRPPVLCPGCSHRGIFYAIKRLKLTAMGDIGCYTLAALPPLSAMDTCLCMGASVGMASGMEKAQGKGKLIAVIGDSTFIHSGITGLIDIVYNKGTTKLCILDNRTTAMTGHQEHPGTGLTLSGEPTHQLDLEALCRAIGVNRVVKVNPFDISEILHVLKEEMAVDEPSVIISDGFCIIREGTRLGEPYYVDEELCVECDLCFQVGCPAIEKSTSGKAWINPLLCVGCDVCAQVCKPGAILRGEKRAA